MISEEMLKDLINFGPGDVARVLARSGYTGQSFEDAKFVGITTGGEFCYLVKYWDDDGGPMATLELGKVFVRLDAVTQQLVAEF